MNTEAADKEKEEISRQQFWYTTAVLTFIALVANLTKSLDGWFQFSIAAAMITGAMLLGFYMVIVCHREYCARNKRETGWWEALAHSFKERKGAFFCNALLFIAGVGLILVLASGVRRVESDRPANGSQPLSLETNRTSSAAGSCR